MFDQQLRSRFDWLRDPPSDDVATPPPVLIAFDVLYVNGRDLTGKALRDPPGPARGRHGAPGARHDEKRFPPDVQVHPGPAGILEAGAHTRGAEKGQARRPVGISPGRRGDQIIPARLALSMCGSGRTRPDLLRLSEGRLCGI
jgi:hypothetical protein